MLFLSRAECATWLQLGKEALAGAVAPEACQGAIRSVLWPHFCFFVAGLYAPEEPTDDRLLWLAAGSQDAPGNLNRYLLAYLHRNHNRLVRLEPVFVDPRPYVHFTTVPALCVARGQLIRYAVASLPKWDRAIRFMDIGCGDGALTRELLQALCASGNSPGIEEILLIDASASMLALARQSLTAAFPQTKITTIEGRAEDVIAQIAGSFDVLLSSLAWHHMPYQTKEQLARCLGQHVHNVLLYEVNANHDTPELHSPELAISLYQVYGGIIKLVMDHPAPQAVIEACIDRFLVGELVSLMTQLRGIRSDYHMLRHQWHQLFTDGLGAGFECLGDITCWSDSEIDLFLLHYGRSA